ncbi:hypothetical protein E8E13_001383 [Curvularia kusanoi]|uniref:Protein kinase domain-containing protein n=1 Tax=Curvularia kusanoi TaxID=90978 RepID=A0A9P4W921_CURKU|nr:hypothetical protein E8E13_001383 [Curvularia kusanoi]
MHSEDGLSQLCPWYKPSSLGPWPYIVRHCILGLEHLHNNGIRHGDLRTGKVLLVDESDGASPGSKVRAVISDLGIGKGYMEVEKTTSDGADLHLAPEEKAPASGTYRSDISSLGYCISWIHALLSSENKQGISQLDELCTCGSSDTFGHVPPLLKLLRQTLDKTKHQDMIKFLFTLEDMIASTLLEESAYRSSLQWILATLDAYIIATMDEIAVVELGQPTCTLPAD